jgi:NADPH:quinone reductase-like Zn-dependent oxidoreductase
MRAVVIHETGGPEVLRVEEVPEPEAGEDEVLVQVEAVAVNRYDLNQRAAGASRFPVVLGRDASGTRVDTGERVVVTGAKGAYAEKTTARARSTFPLPDGVNAAVAAAFLTPYRVAWWALAGRAELSGRETLLVQGGASSTGQAAIDIGRLLGATVYATAGEPKHVRLQELGAAPLPYDAADMGELSADVVFDPLGARTFGRSLEALGRGGRLVTPGAVGESSISLDVWTLVGKRARIEGIAGEAAPPETVPQLLELLAQGELHPWVERELPLERAAEAHRVIEAGEVIGRVVLVPSTRS